MTKYFLNRENCDGCVYAYKVTGADQIRIIENNPYDQISGHYYNRLKKASRNMPYFNDSYDKEILQIDVDTFLEVKEI